MERINLDHIGKATQKKIRDLVGVGNIKSLIKLAKESGIDVGIRTDTQRYRTYRHFATIINDRIDDERKVAKLEEDRIKRETKQYKKNIKRGVQSFDFQFSNEEQAKKLLRYASVKNNYLITTPSGKLYTLNGFTAERLQTLLNEETGTEQPDTKSDEELLLAFRQNMTFTFELVDRHTGRSLNDGGFFAFTHDTTIDLLDFQIGNEITEKLVEDNCFLYALRKSGIIENMEAVSCMVIGRDIPQKMLKEVAEKFGIYITVRRPIDGSKINYKVTVYGDVSKPELKLGLINNHYFLNKKVPYTSYAIKHYEELKHKPRWNEFIKKDERDKKRYIESYDLIELMKKYGYFKPIVLTSALQKTIYSDKAIEIPTLDVCACGINATPNCYDEKKPKYDDMINVVFDFETNTIVSPYMVHIYAEHDNGTPYIDKTFHGSECGKQMLNYLAKLKKPIRLLAHNAGFDLRPLFKHLFAFNIINRGKMLLRANGRYYFDKEQYFHVEIQDTYAHISEKLEKFGKMFQLPVKKEVMPYKLYTEANVAKHFIPIAECVSHFSKDADKKEFLKNCTEWDCIAYGSINIIKYSQVYCRLDCIVLWKGYMKFKTWIGLICGLNIDNYVSAASVANDYMMKEGVYDGTCAVSGIVREFIQKAMVGGRTMMAENKQAYIKTNVDDFDAVSLYPSAMKRMGDVGGYLKGLPKIITDLTYGFLQRQDGYFVEIKVTKIGKRYKFPLMSTMGEVRDFTNDIEGHVMIVDRFTLEDLITYHQAEFEIIKGYYYDEGRNPKILEVITHLFETRKKEKSNGNPIEQVFKLLMNSAYGKTLLKPFDTDSHYVCEKGKSAHISKYFKVIKEITPLHNGSYKIDHYKGICDHFNNCFIGVEVLSMSKRIMNEVMCLAEDNGLNMYYQDTDSIHIDSISVPVLAEKYRQLYGRELIGKEMGQFHTDFKSDTLKGELVSEASIYLSKKCYIDRLTNGTGIDYHVRMKGIPTQSIEYYAKEHHMTVFEVYEALFNGEEISFDLCCGGDKFVPDFKADMTIVALQSFVRKICFKKT